MYFHLMIIQIKTLLPVLAGLGPCENIMSRKKRERASLPMPLGFCAGDLVSPR